MKLLLIDLDDTLIDLSMFKEHLYITLLKNYSIPVELSKEIYTVHKLKDNWPSLFINQINTEHKVPLDQLNALFEECFKKIILIKKSANYLHNFEGKKYIFSFGTKSFQMQKISQFQLDRAVDGIFITLQKKIEYLSKMIENDTVTIDSVAYTDVTVVDNKQEFIDDVRNTYPWITVVNVADIV